MGYSKFQGLLRSLCALAPLSLPLEEARRFTTYSLRRRFPSVPDRLQLPPERRAEIGDRVDVLPDGAAGWKAPREPRCVRYSAARLEASASTQRVCLAALWSAHDTGYVGDESIRLAADPTVLYQSVLGPEGAASLKHRVLRPSRLPSIQEFLTRLLFFVLWLGIR